MKTNNIFIFFILLAVFSCKPEMDEFSPVPGNADFTKYVAIGSSATSGFADGELYMSGQQYSFPCILAQQISLAGGGEFRQPLMKDELGFGNKLILGYITDCKGVTSLGPVKAGGTPDPGNFTSIASQGPFNNFGVPGSKSFMTTLAGYGTLNPYFGRFMSSAAASILSDAVSVGGTFFTIWLGSVDILMYAMKGGDTGGDSLTPEGIFGQSLTAIVAGLKADGAQGAIATVPGIASLPYFTTVPAKGLVLDQSGADLLMAAYAAYNAGAQAMGVPQIQFSAGNNYWIIRDTHPPYNTLGNLRQMRQGEYLTLAIPQDSLKCAYWGSQKPIPDYFVLDSSEVQRINSKTAAYNDIIINLAEDNGLALAEANALYKTLQSGIVFDGIKLSTTFVTGGLFSLDGLHLNPRGNAVMANCFIEAINDKFGANIPTVNVGDFPGIKFP